MARKRKAVCRDEPRQILFRLVREYRKICSETYSLKQYVDYLGEVFNTRVDLTERDLEILTEELLNVSQDVIGQINAISYGYDPKTKKWLENESVYQYTRQSKEEEESIREFIKEEKNGKQ